VWKNATDLQTVFISLINTMMTIIQKRRDPLSNPIQARIPVTFDSCNDRGWTE